MADALLEAARLERDQRADAYPRKVREGLIEVEAATVDYQCWVAIALFLETGEFLGFVGGHEHWRDDAPWIGWPELEKAAGAALAAIAAKLTAAEQDPVQVGHQPRLDALRRRHANLTWIHRKVALRAETWTILNAELRAAAAARRARAAA